MEELTDRLKTFLAQIAKANKELEEKIQAEGSENIIIDGNLVSAENEELINEEDEENNHDEDYTSNSNGGRQADDYKIELNFAIGDIEKEANENPFISILLEKEENDPKSEDEIIESIKEFNSPIARIVRNEDDNRKLKIYEIDCDQNGEKYNKRKKSL